MTLRVRVDRQVCQGSRGCVRRAPRSFRLDGDGKAVPTEPPGDPVQVVREAAAACPFFAIIVDEKREGDPV